MHDCETKGFYEALAAAVAGAGCCPRKTGSVMAIATQRRLDNEAVANRVRPVQPHLPFAVPVCHARKAAQNEGGGRHQHKKVKEITLFLFGQVRVEMRRRLQKAPGPKFPSYLQEVSPHLLWSAHAGRGDRGPRHAS